LNKIDEHLKRDLTGPILVNQQVAGRVYDTHGEVLQFAVVMF
jgi:hypothetical protein